MPHQRRFWNGWRHGFGTQLCVNLQRWTSRKPKTPWPSYSIERCGTCGLSPSRFLARESVFSENVAATLRVATARMSPTMLGPLWMRVIMTLRRGRPVASSFFMRERSSASGVAGDGSTGAQARRSSCTLFGLQIEGRGRVEHPRCGLEEAPAMVKEWCWPVRLWFNMRPATFNLTREFSVDELESF